MKIECEFHVTIKKTNHLHMKYLISVCLLLVLGTEAFAGDNDSLIVRLNNLMENNTTCTLDKEQKIQNLKRVLMVRNLLPRRITSYNVCYTKLLRRVMETLEWVGLTDKVKSRPAQLSGGECQRVAIARAMVKRPNLVLADEPTANLDSKNSHNILQTMEKINKELKTSFIFATHDEKVIGYLKRIIRLQDGNVVEDKVIS